MAARRDSLPENSADLMIANILYLEDFTVVHYTQGRLLYRLSNYLSLKMETTCFRTQSEYDC